MAFLCCECFPSECQHLAFTWQCQDSPDVKRERVRSKQWRVRARVTHYIQYIPHVDSNLLEYTHTSLQYNSWLHPLKTSIWCVSDPFIQSHKQQMCFALALMYPLYEPRERKIGPESPPDHSHFNFKPSLIHVPLCARHKQCAQSHYHYRGNQTY